MYTNSQILLLEENTKKLEEKNKRIAQLENALEMAYLYHYIPWGAAKGVYWEDLSGDMPLEERILKVRMRKALRGTTLDKVFLQE